MEYLGNCPLCAKELHLQQINFTTAIFICLDIKCPYPVNGDCMIVKRRIENINKTVDLFAEYQKLESCTNVSETTESIAQRSLMVDLEELLNAHGDYHHSNETKCEDVLQLNEEVDVKYENLSQSSQTPCLEIHELDDLLTELFRSKVEV